MSEQLIYALSTLGELGLAKFNDIFKRLYLPEDDKDYDYNMRHQTIRYLESLGYCEFDYDQRRVFMCPPALVLLPSFGLPKALLTGARTPKFIASIKKSVKDTFDFCPGALGGWLVLPGTVPLKYLEANDWAHDVGFKVVFQPCYLFFTHFLRWSPDFRNSRSIRSSSSPHQKVRMFVKAWSPSL